MSKNIVYIIVFFCAALHSGCMIYIPTPKIFQQKEIDYRRYYKDSCAYWNKQPLAQRLSEIPFKGADKVEVVSFQNPTIREIQRPNDPPKPKNDHYNTFFERFTLSQNDIDTLSQILNFTDTTILIKPLPKNRKEESYMVGLADKMVGCFNPHHALLFYNKNGEQYARWDMCFECGNHEIRGVYYDRNLASFFCYGQQQALVQLFKRIGIKKYFSK